MKIVKVKNQNKVYEVKFDDDAQVNGVPIEKVRMLLSRQEGILRCKAYVGYNTTRSMTVLLHGQPMIPLNDDYLDLQRKNLRPIEGKDKSHPVRK